jgi:hypothetical protein
MPDEDLIRLTAAACGVATYEDTAGRNLSAVRDHPCSGQRWYSAETPNAVERLDGSLRYPPLT